jgi:YD repeat-containing protein
VDDTAGNWLQLTYAGEQINRKKNIVIHTITAAPVVGWNEVTVTTTEPFRWIQGISAPNNNFRMAEIEFYRPAEGGGTVKLSGTPYGTTPDIGNGSNSFDKAFDNNTSTGFGFIRPNMGIAGIDLGTGNESHVAKIRYFIHSANADRLNSYIGHQFVGCVETPEIITVMKQVSTSGDQTVNYGYDIHEDTSIGQSHLVLGAVDYLDANDAVSSQASISWVTSQDGLGPCVSRSREPRSGSATPDVAFDYFPVNLSVKGQPYLVKDGANGTTIFSSEPKATHKFVAADGGIHTITNTNTSNYLPSSSTDAAGKTTSYTWSASNFLATKATPAGTTTYTWNYMGQPLTVTHPSGLKETNTYDVQGRLLSKALSATGQVTRTTTYTRDSATGRVTKITYPDGSYEQFTFNAVGLVTRPLMNMIPPAVLSRPPTRTVRRGSSSVTNSATSSGSLMARISRNGLTTTSAARLPISTRPARLHLTTMASMATHAHVMVPARPPSSPVPPDARRAASMTSRAGSFRKPKAFFRLMPPSPPTPAT